MQVQHQQDSDWLNQRKFLDLRYKLLLAYLLLTTKLEFNGDGMRSDSGQNMEHHRRSQARLDLFVSW